MGLVACIGLCIGCKGGPTTPHSGVKKTYDDVSIITHAVPAITDAQAKKKTQRQKKPLASRGKEVRDAQGEGHSKVDSTAARAPCRPDFVSVFERVSPSTLGVAAGHMVHGRFKVTRSGSGFVWDRAGHVVTNAHLVAEAGAVRIRSRDGRVFLGQIVGLDAGTDLAVLRVKGLGLDPVARGVLADLKPGQWVAAVGNPYGMDHSIAVGVISAVGRRNLPGNSAKYAEFIQSDVSIFPGNSGGPLVDTQGRVIGLNTAKLGQGLSFSTHIDMVGTVVERLVEHGRFDRGFAGLYLKPVSFKKAERLGLGSRKGAVIRALVGEGPADLAGLVPGDVILTIGTRTIHTPGAVPWLIAATSPGTTVPVVIAREYERITLDLTVGSVP